MVLLVEIGTTDADRVTEVLGELMERRNPAHAQAPIRVTSDTGPQSNGVARIIAALGDYLA